MKKYTVSLRPLGRSVRCSAGSKLLNCCRANGVPVASTCGGRGKCNSCKVRIIEGAVNPPAGGEIRILSAAELKRGWRLACQVIPAGDLVVYLPGGNALSSTPAFRASLLPRIVPDSGRSRPVSFGAAIDLGTTKIAGYLLDLADGAILCNHAVANPQSVFGDDVISRITYAMASPANARKLRKAAMGAVDGLIRELSTMAGVEPGKVTSVAVCGNTAMHHLALGLPVSQLARAPYLPRVKDPVNTTGEESWLKSVMRARVYFLPNIGGYVGGDHVAVLAAVGATHLKFATLIVDIGTNTEISLVVKGRVTSVSCASGPAFEGGHIKCGMKASAGAIDKVVIRDNRIKYRTVGGGKPAGICGSGMLDAVAQMVAEGITDPGGRMDKGHPLVRSREGRPEVLIAGLDKAAGGEDIGITQADVRELQLAKAAVRTGINVLLKSAGISGWDVRKVIVAGTFGNYIDIKSAIRVGMLPELPLRRFSQVGNAAGAGTCMVLVSGKTRAKMETMARSVEYLELAGQPGFMDLYVKSLILGIQS